MLPVVKGKSRHPLSDPALHTGAGATGRSAGLHRHLGGMLYLVSPAAWVSGFCWKPFATCREKNEDKEPAAHRLFGVSLLYMFVLFRGPDRRATAPASGPGVHVRDDDATTPARAPQTQYRTGRSCSAVLSILVLSDVDRAVARTCNPLKGLGPMSSDVKHDYHLVDPSPWPIVGSIGAFTMLVGAVFWMNKDYTGFFGLPVNGQPWIFLIGVALVLYTMAGWWRDVIRELVVLGNHTPVVKLHLRYGMLLFIASEVMFFVAWFWAYFNSAIFPQ